MIARILGMREDRVEALRYAGILHDVGKLGVPTRVLQKTGPLSDMEFDAIKRHPRNGTEMVRGISFLEEAYNGIMHHHERLDGRGYPLGLSGSDIPEFARIIAVADAFDSMTSTRSYRGARDVPAALAELQRCAGTQFDGVMVQALVRRCSRSHGRQSHPPSSGCSTSRSVFRPSTTTTLRRTCQVRWTRHRRRGGGRGEPERTPAARQWTCSDEVAGREAHVGRRVLRWLSPCRSGGSAACRRWYRVDGHRRGGTPRRSLWHSVR